MITIIECSYCGNDLREDEIENPREDESGDVMCDQCYEDEFLEHCSLCENYYDKPTKPEETFFVVAKEVSGQVGVDPGFYKVLNWPYMLCATGFGFEMLYEGSIKLEKSADINSMLRKLHGVYREKFSANEICPDCFEKYSNPKYHRINYCNPWMKLHSNIYERGIIKEGK